ncbi:sulfatase-like hydrolase/transferase, partial [Salmonella enterica]|uniref:sulfatase-like hydrolase/transferase n=1 Tax=Salmonella enterica TaxID=28901 RepID=UPI000AE3A646
SYGHEVVNTQNIDPQAQEGITLTEYYSSPPLCTPCRAGILTCRMPSRSGVLSWIPEVSNVSIGCNELSISDLLRPEGYVTAMMGKLHLNAGGDRSDQPQPKELGFDYSLVNPAGFVTDVTLDNARERPRYGGVHPTGWMRTG